MARQRRKQPGTLATLILEFATLAGILGVAQPTMREQIWSAVSPAPPAAANRFSPPAHAGLYPSVYVAPSNSVASVNPRYDWSPPAYSAQMVPLPQTINSPAPYVSRWR